MPQATYKGHHPIILAGYNESHSAVAFELTFRPPVTVCVFVPEDSWKCRRLMTSSLACPSQASIRVQPCSFALHLNRIHRSSAWTRNPSFPLLGNDTARDPKFDLVDILQNCPNLRHLALVGCSLLAGKRPPSRSLSFTP